MLRLIEEFEYTLNIEDLDSEQLNYFENLRKKYPKENDYDLLLMVENKYKILNNKCQNGDFSDTNTYYI